MKLKERLEKLINKDIVITLLATDEQGDNYHTKGELIEIGEDYFVTRQLPPNASLECAFEAIFPFNGILCISPHQSIEQLTSRSINKP